MSLVALFYTELRIACLLPSKQAFFILGRNKSIPSHPSTSLFEVIIYLTTTAHVPTIMKTLAVCSLFALLNACADYRIHLASDVASVVETEPATEASYRLFFVGDLGHSPEQGLVTLRTITELSQEAGPSSSLALLGDLTGKDGLQSGDDETKAWLRLIIEQLEDQAGEVFYAPGDYELGQNGQFGRLQRLERFFDRHCDKKVRFMPNNACSGPDDREIFPGVGLIGASSAWYLADWRKEEELNEGCDYTDRPSFLLALTDEIKSYRDQVKIVLMHHPLQSNGNRGGRYSVGQHLFPLNDLLPRAYIPFPIIGSIARGIQTTAGSRRDLSNLLYKEMVADIERSIEDEDMVIFLSGHEHNLLYVDKENFHIVTAGSGSECAPAGGGNKATFAYGAIGFGELSFYPEGEVFLSFYSVDENGNRERVFNHCIIADRFAANEADLPVIPAEVLNSQELQTTVYGDSLDEHGNPYSSTFGRTYRRMYYEPLRVQALQLDTIHDGLEPLRRGGGMTTQSLHLQGGDGHRYQLRSVRKNPVQLLPGALEQSFAADLTRDALTSLHPFAPLSLPPMQEQLGLLHIRPELYYVPKQISLASFNDNFGGEMYWLEQRPDGDWSNTGLFGDSEEIISNSAAREAIMDSWKHRADQRNYLRARLFDLLIGDWDRHRDQWRWASREEEDLTYYSPVPRDRDQVYSNFDAGIIRIAALFVPHARKLRPFSYDFEGQHWLFMNGKWNDRFFLSEMEKEDFLAEARFIMQELDDATIDAGLALLPAEVQTESLETYHIDGKLKSRRDQLEAIALLYYQHLAKEVDVTATNKDDYIQLTAQENGDLLVELFDADKDNQADELFYSRLFKAEDTREVRIYALDGDDTFEVIGEHRTNIRVRLIGGTDDDIIAANGRLAARVYDHPNGMEFEQGRRGLRDRRSRRHPELNLYQFQDYEFDYSIPMPQLGFNVDDGFFLGGGVQFIRHGFKPAPFAQEHKLLATYGSLNTLHLTYQAAFNNSFGRYTDFLLDAEYLSDNYVYNFFGLGNETENAPDGDLDFNRSRQAFAHLYPRVRFRSRRNRMAWELGPYYRSAKVNRRADGFLATAELPERVFSQQHFVGFRINFNYNNLAHPLLPDNGLVVQLGAQYNSNFSVGLSQDFRRFNGSVALYRFFGNQVFGIATRIGFEHVNGDFDFWQAAQLGGRTNFRALRSERFLGNTAFYQNFDIRLRGFGFGENSVPTIGGIILGFDHGRVWLSGENSKAWHFGYGGGLWIAPLSAAILHLTYFTSENGSRVSFGAGFPF